MPMRLISQFVRNRTGPDLLSRPLGHRVASKNVEISENSWNNNSGQRFGNKPDDINNVFFVAKRGLGLGPLPQHLRMRIKHTRMRLAVLTGRALSEMDISKKKKHGNIPIRYFPLVISFFLSNGSFIKASAVMMAINRGDQLLQRFVVSKLPN